MQFLYPIGLLAFAALIIPLIIHLWNVKQGKTLKIGSIALLGESSRASSKSLKINDWLLLILRCLIIILTAFIVAQPFLKKTLSAKKSGWILVSKSNFPEVYTDNRKSIDSLTKLGYEIHDFNVGFTTINLKDTANIDTTGAKPISYTSLLKQLNNYIPKGNTVYIFADKRLNAFDNEVPEISYKVTWKPLNRADTLRGWITDYAGKKYEAKSNPSATIYKPINDDPSSIKISLYEAPGNSDKKYLTAALNAISAFSGRTLEINSEGRVKIGFWLSDEPVSSEFKTAIDSNGTLFKYEKGKLISEASFLNIDGKKIPLNRRIKSPKSINKIWTDGFGNGILTKEKLSNLNVYQFYSRLNPQWNQLVWDEVFVKALMPIVLHDENAEDFGFENNIADQRRLAFNQKEVVQTNNVALVEKSDQTESIGYILWLVTFIIFVAERILSFRKKTVVYVKN